MGISLLIYKQRFKNPNYKSTAGRNYAYIRYIATRPGVTENDGMKHGLFGCLAAESPLTEFPDWQDVAQLVYRNSRQHITMYRSVVSFEEDTAKELTLSDQRAWQRYIQNHISTIAEKNCISRAKLQWVAALHKEKGHPHLHVAFWDNSDWKRKIRNPYTHPSIPNGIRRQMIKDTFAERIRAYGLSKNKAESDLRRISDELVKDFEIHIRQMKRTTYQKLRNRYDMEENIADLFQFSDQVLNETADRIFRLKSIFPRQGRVAYQLLPEELKKEVDELVAYLLEQTKGLREARTEYVTSKMKMVSLYGGSEEYFSSQQCRFEAEADKIIANRILGMIKLLNRLDDEGRTADRIHVRRLYYARQMITEMLEMLVYLSDVGEQNYEKAQSVSGSGLSAEAKRELYLKYEDRGYER